MAKATIGIWLIGAKGGVATTAIAGLAALRKGLISEAGLVTQLPQFAALDLAPFDAFLVGGHEIRAVSLVDEVERLVTESRTLPAAVFARIHGELEKIDSRIRPGTLCNVGSTIAALATAELPEQETALEAVARLRADLESFARQNRLQHVVVVNVASTEPPIDAAGLPPSWSAMEKLLAARSCKLPASSLYAIAAIEAGCSYINFTPSLGSTLPAIDELVRLRGSRHYGCDGKTGETLLKSVLAPMFARRNLQVMSWVGHNIFGNMDGVVLNDPVNKQSKIASKDHLIGDILGYKPQTLVSIEYIASMGDWKTAWDHVHFQGFLGAPMTFQFTWQGCDSVLAAPLVLDLARFTELAFRQGHVGSMPFLASFFKSPFGVSEQAFDRQFAALEEWAKAVEPPADPS
jgi:myo-inositol-1-phosphate synthase